MAPNWYNFQKKCPLAHPNVNGDQTDTQTDGHKKCTMFILDASKSSLVWNLTDISKRCMWLYTLLWPWRPIIKHCLCSNWFEEPLSILHNTFVLLVLSFSVCSNTHNHKLGSHTAINYQLEPKKPNCMLWFYEVIFLAFKKCYSTTLYMFSNIKCLLMFSKCMEF